MSGKRQEVAQEENEQTQTQKAQEKDQIPEKKRLEGYQYMLRKNRWGMAVCREEWNNHHFSVDLS